jgi:putative ABC transport system ATP-binding protein
MIQLSNIHVIFNKGTQIENHALKGVNLKIQEGEFITVIGGNGAGKSTLMSVLTGELLSNTGSLSIDGEDCTRKGTVQRSAQVARIFQDPMVGTFSHLSILENLAIATQRGQKRNLRQAIQKNSTQVFKDKLMKLDMGLEKRLNDRVSLLSGGQRQALSLVMATLQKAQILILDEHTAALDPKTARLILELTREIVEESMITTLMVTHSMHQALEFGTRTLLMKQGEIVEDLDGEQRKELTPAHLLDLFE